MSGGPGRPLPDWVDLATRHREEIVLAVRLDFDGGGNPTFEPDEIAPTDPEGAEALLRELAAEGAGGPWLRYDPRVVCGDCLGPLSPPNGPNKKCLRAGCVNGADGEPCREEEVPVWRLIDPEPVRRAGWLVALHGMNTRGPWQEGFNWLVSRSYGQMVPVAVYKYGIVRSGAFVEFLQVRHRKRLAERLQRYRSQAEVAGFRSPPDVIAHSFGTWLLGQALLDDLERGNDPPLRVGRVILTGCILQPDFPWQRLLDSEPPRVEAVLNHYGTRDFWALVAHCVIPGSGPAGRRGFNTGHPRVLNLEAPGFTHSQFFDEAEMPGLFVATWAQFLSRQVDRVAVRIGAEDPADTWRPAPWLLRARLARWVLLGAALGLATLLAGALVVGARAVWDEPVRGLAAAGGLAAAALALELLRRGFRRLCRLAPWPW